MICFSVPVGSCGITECGYDSQPAIEQPWGTSYDPYLCAMFAEFTFNLISMNIGDRGTVKAQRFLICLSLLSNLVTWSTVIPDSRLPDRFSDFNPSANTLSESPSLEYPGLCHERAVVLCTLDASDTAAVSLPAVGLPHRIEALDNLLLAGTVLVDVVSLAYIVCSTRGKVVVWQMSVSNLWRDLTVRIFEMGSPSTLSILYVSPFRTPSESLRRLYIYVMVQSACVCGAYSMHHVLTLHALNMLVYAPWGMERIKGG